MVPNRNGIPVIVQLRDAIEALTGLRLATYGGKVTFGALPTDTDTMTIGGSAEAIEDVYTFLDALTGADNEVHIETTRDATMANLVDAINVNTPPDAIDRVQGVKATLTVVGGADNDTLTLEPTVKGVSGNLTLAEDTGAARVAVTSLYGGADLLPTLTYTKVKIDQTAGEGVTALKPAGLGANVKCYLCSLFGTMAVGGNLTIEDSDGTDLSGPMPIAANGGLVLGPYNDPKLIIESPVNKGMAINTSQKFYGFAVIGHG